jgi:hypothetical protein
MQQTGMPFKRMRIKQTTFGLHTAHCSASHRITSCTASHLINSSMHSFLSMLLAYWSCHSACPYYIGELTSWEPLAPALPAHMIKVRQAFARLRTKGRHVSTYREGSTLHRYSALLHQVRAHTTKHATTFSTCQHKGVATWC